MKFYSIYFMVANGGLFVDAKSTILPDQFEMAEGLLTGALGLDPSDITKMDLQDCKNDLENVLVDVASGIEDLTKLNMHGVSMFVDSLGAAFWKVGDALSDCTPFVNQPNAKMELDQLEQMQAILQNPDDFQAKTSFPESLKINGIQIWKDLYDSRQEFVEGDWGNSGYFLGRAARATLGGKMSMEQLQRTFESKMDSEENSSVEMYL